MVARQYFISGLVQGVGYRYFVIRMARQHGVVGYVRNLPDGRVEVVAEAEPAAMAAFRRELERGPSYARVMKIQERQREPTGQFTSFNVEF